MTGQWTKEAVSLNSVHTKIGKLMTCNRFFRKLVHGFPGGAASGLLKSMDLNGKNAVDDPQSGKNDIKKCGPKSDKSLIWSDFFKILYDRYGGFCVVGPIRKKDPSLRSE